MFRGLLWIGWCEWGGVRAAVKAKAFQRNAYRVVMQKIVIAQDKGIKLRRMLQGPHDVWGDAKLQGLFDVL